MPNMLLPEREEQYQSELSRASDATLRLAMSLQQAAFHGRRDYPDSFVPAPCYLSQATAIHADALLAATVQHLIMKGHKQ